MARQRGILIEADDPWGIVLTPNGEFKRVILDEPGYIGQEVYFSETRSPLISFRIPRYWLAAAVLILALFTPVVFNLIVQPAEPVAYVSVDINPSIELSVDSQAKIVGVRSLNSDGEQLLTNLQLVKKPLRDGIEAITLETVREGFIQPNHSNYILVAMAVRDDLELAAAWQGEIASTMKQVLAREAITAEVENIKVSESFRNQAEELGLSMGKYAVLLEARKLGADILPADLQSKSVIKALLAANINPAEVLEKLRDEPEQALEDLGTKFKTNTTKNKGNDFDKGRPEPQGKTGPGEDKKLNSSGKDGKQDGIGSLEQTGAQGENKEARGYHENSDNQLEKEGRGEKGQAGKEQKQEAGSNEGEKKPDDNKEHGRGDAGRDWYEDSGKNVDYHDKPDNGYGGNKEK